MNNFSIILDKKINKYIKLNNLTHRSFRNNGLGDPTSIIKRGSTKTITLFKISKFLDIDVRNLLMFDDNTYEFKNSFETFEEFFLFLGKRFKKFRLQKKLGAIDIGDLNRVCAFENGRTIISMKRFFKYLDKLGITSDEFFLKDENYKLSSKYHREVNIKRDLEEKKSESSFCMNDFSKILNKKVDKYIKLNNLTYMSFRNNGLGDPTSIIKRGSTKTITLFKISKFLDIDVRNLLMFDDNTYIFDNSFDNVEEFFIFIGEKFKNFRLQNGLKAINIDSCGVGSVYAFENNREFLSLKKFYSYLDKLGMSSDEFFLNGEEYKILEDNQKIESTKDENLINITFKDIFNRAEELEDIRGVKIAKSVIPTRSMMPTVHVFLNICKSLKVAPNDFMDFDNKNPEYRKLKIDNREYISFLRKTIGACTENSQKFLRLDNIFTFCTYTKTKPQLFFRDLERAFSENGTCSYGDVSMIYYQLKLLVV